VLKRVFLIGLVSILSFFIPKIEESYAWTYTVSAKVVGGNGRVTPSTQKVQPGATARVNIYANLGYHIDSITDNNQLVALKTSPSSPASYSYVINDVRETHDIVVKFVINEYTIKASVSGGHGQVYPTTQVVKFGESLRIQITPDEGYNITGIMDNGLSMEIKNPFTLESIKANHNIVVAFTSFTVNASVEDTNGSVSPTVQTVHSAGKAIITITPNEGFMIKQILVNNKAAKIANPFVLYVYSATTVKVSFTPAIYTIKASSPDGFGKVIVETDQVGHNGSTEIRIMPNRGYSIKGITDNGVVLPIKNKITLKNIKEDHTVLVSFTEFEIRARMMNDNGSISPSIQKMFYGGKAVINIEVDQGYKVIAIRDNKRSMPVRLPYEIPNVKEDHFVEVTFGIVTFTIKATVVGALGEATPAYQTVNYGSKATIQISSFEHDRITGIFDNGKSVLVKNPYVIKAVYEDHEIVITMKTYMVTVNTTSENGYIHPAVQYIQQGQPAVILIFPEVGYHIGSIKDNGKITAINNPYIIQSVEENHEVEVNFAINSYQIQAKAVTQGGRIEPTTQTVHHSEKALVRIFPDEGYVIESIVDNGLKMDINNLYYIYYVTDHHSIEVRFKKK
jgi:hypothetical protein